MKNPNPVNLQTSAEIRKAGWQAECRDADGHLCRTHVPFETDEEIVWLVREALDHGETVTIWPLSATPTAGLSRSPNVQVAPQPPNVDQLDGEQTGPAALAEHVLNGKFAFGARVRKTKGTSWHGRVVGFYSTELTPIGYAVESEREPGSVQIYPEAALANATDLGGRRAPFPRDLSSPCAVGNETPFSAPGNDERPPAEYYPQNVGDNEISSTRSAAERCRSDGRSTPAPSKGMVGSAPVENPCGNRGDND